MLRCFPHAHTDQKSAGHDRFGTVPANVIMASNSIQNNKRLHILERLANSSWIEAAYTERISAIHTVSPRYRQLRSNSKPYQFILLRLRYRERKLLPFCSTQEFTWIKTLTRSYLGQSASISQSIQHLKTQKVEGSASSANSFPGQSLLL